MAKSMRDLCRRVRRKGDNAEPNPEEPGAQRDPGDSSEQQSQKGSAAQQDPGQGHSPNDSEEVNGGRVPKHRMRKL